MNGIGLNYNQGDPPNQLELLSAITKYIKADHFGKFKVLFTMRFVKTFWLKTTELLHSFVLLSFNI